LLLAVATLGNAKPISAVMTRTVPPAGMDWGLLAAARRSDHHSRRAGDLVRPITSRAASRSAGCKESRRHGKLAWMAWTPPTAIFFALCHHLAS